MDESRAGNNILISEERVKRARKSLSLLQRPGVCFLAGVTLRDILCMHYSKPSLWFCLEAGVGSPPCTTSLSWFLLVVIQSACIEESGIRRIMGTSLLVELIVSV